MFSMMLHLYAQEDRQMAYGQADTRNYSLPSSELLQDKTAHNYSRISSFKNITSLFERKKVMTLPTPSKKTPNNNNYYNYNNNNKKSY